MRFLKGILIWPLLWVMRKLHLGDGWEAPSREELRQQLIEHMAESNELHNQTDFWSKHQ